MKKILKKKVRLSIIAALCLSVFLTVSCEQNGEDIQVSNLSFTPCQPNMLKSKSLSSTDKVDVAFTDKGVQITYSDFAVACDFTTVNVTHTFVNGFLNITQQGSPNRADCICYTDVSYTIEGISQNEVNLIFINGKQVYCYNENYPNNNLPACNEDATKDIIYHKEDYKTLVLKEYPEGRPEISSFIIITKQFDDTEPAAYLIGGFSTYRICNYPQYAKEWNIPTEGIPVLLSGKVYPPTFNFGFQPANLFFADLELTTFKNLLP